MVTSAGLSRQSWLGACSSPRPESAASDAGARSAEKESCLTPLSLPRAQADYVRVADITSNLAIDPALSATVDPRWIAITPVPRILISRRPFPVMAIFQAKSSLAKGLTLPTDLVAEQRVLSLWHTSLSRMPPEERRSLEGRM